MTLGVGDDGADEKPFNRGGTMRLSETTVSYKDSTRPYRNQPTQLSRGHPTQGRAIRGGQCAGMIGLGTESPQPHRATPWIIQGGRRKAEASPWENPHERHLFPTVSQVPPREGTLRTHRTPRSVTYVPAGDHLVFAVAHG